ncbi:MAG: acyltransferase [Chloroflexi bacterium]|nr:MAG: acyltransferase [Chloroflexota bacterium]
MSERLLPALFRLPRPPIDYLREPRRSVRRLFRFFNARWQLRSSDHLGPWVRVQGRMHVSNRGHLNIGERVAFLSHPVPIILHTLPGARLDIGDRTVLNYGIDISAVKEVRIGADCLLGTHVSILDNDFHELTARDRMPESRPVRIADGVWIGNRVVILPGVSIGAGAAVGAGSVVMTDIPERCLALGNPARVIKKF